MIWYIGYICDSIKEFGIIVPADLLQDHLCLTTSEL